MVWNRISNSCSFQPWYKNGGSWTILKSYFNFKNCMFFFYQICIILPIAARADFQLWGALTALWKVKSDWNEWKLSIMVREIQIVWKFLILTFSTRCERAQRARGHVRTGNFEMLKITWFVLKIVKKWFWEFFNCDARARGHGLSVCYPKPWNLCVLNLVNLWWMVMKIWMIT